MGRLDRANAAVALDPEDYDALLTAAQRDPEPPHWPFPGVGRLVRLDGKRVFQAS